MCRFGVVKEIAHPKRAYLDFDRRARPDYLGIVRACRIIGIRLEWLRYDRTRRGWHVVCAFSESLTPAECVAFQSVCGSDPRRETLNLMRVFWIRRNRIRGPFAARWNLLFSEKLV